MTTCPASTDDPYSKKILVVDDYAMTREMIVEALQQSGYRSIKEADNGLDALNILKTDNVDLVISDVMMPQMNGMDLLHQVRELSPSTAIIMMTGQPATDMTVSAMKGGAVDFIKKPFNINDLIYKVQIYLREKCIIEAADSGEQKQRQDLSEQTKELSIKSYIYDALENLEGNNDEIFEKLADIATHIAGVEVCRIVIYDGETDAFYLKVAKGSGRMEDQESELSALKPFFKQVLEKGEALVIHGEDHPAISPSLICIPLTIRGQAFGILSVRKKKHMGVFKTRDLRYLTSLAKRASLNLENKLLYESLYANVLDTFKSLIASIQLRDHYTEEHSMRVTDSAVKIALAMGCSSADIQTIKIAGPLHDIGKIAIPDRILLKPDRLTDEEYSIIKTHAHIGSQIISSIALFDRER
ncbi:MAG: response regulator, partial [Syntrophales bacterium]|nr:response regulator [Syntrophales bacterium]